MPDDKRPDLHHSQGVEVAAVLAGIPEPEPVAHPVACTHGCGFVCSVCAREECLGCKQMVPAGTCNGIKTIGYYRCADCRDS